MNILDKEIARIRSLASRNVMATIGATSGKNGVSMTVTVHSGLAVNSWQITGRGFTDCIDQVGRTLRGDMNTRVSMMLGWPASWHPFVDDAGETVGDIIRVRDAEFRGSTFREALEKARLSIQEAEND